MIKLNEVKTPEQLEWMRVHRNDPAQYKYFRQDRPISKEDQVRWWKHRDPTKIKYWIVESNGEPIGAVGFNPLNSYARTAEFTIFIIDPYKEKGYGKRALNKLLKYGFEQLHLSCIYSDMLDYPGEGRWKFYEKMGFEKRENQMLRHYLKQGQKIYSIPFFMTKDTWEKLK